MGLRVVYVLAAVAVGFVALGLLVRSMEWSFIFFPSRYPLGIWDPAQLGLRAEEVTFRAADGLQLHGWWIEAVRPGADDAVADVAPPVLLWFHGNAGNLTDRGPHARRLAEEGLSVFLFDYRGYGRSQGTPSEEGIYADGEAAYDYLTTVRGVPPQRVVLFGRSLGSAPAARLAARVDHAGLILVSPFPSAKSMARRMFLGVPLHWFARSRFPVSVWVAERAEPLLIIHGEADSVVPQQLGRKVFAAAVEPKQFVSLPGADHNDILLMGGHLYLEAVRSFSWSCVETAGG